MSGAGDNEAELCNGSPASLLPPTEGAELEPVLIGERGIEPLPDRLRSDPHLVVSPRILVVDDEPDHALLFKVTLEEIGHVTLSADVYEALAMLQHNDYDVIVLDLVMPGASGVELLSHLREMDSETPVVVHSAVATGPLGGEARRVGASKVLSKDGGLDVLLGSVAAAVLRTARSRQASVNPAGASAQSTTSGAG